jgi:hypothetical protein
MVLIVVVQIWLPAACVKCMQHARGHKVLVTVMRHSTLSSAIGKAEPGLLTLQQVLPSCVLLA